jgi:TM2 domain-containing membrane protein YozV
MTDTTVIDVERAKAERKSPVLLWVLNILWPGLGNLVAGQVVAGLVFGIAHWFFLLLFFLTNGLAGILCFINWIAASAIGHHWINRRYVKALEAIQTKQGSAAGGES